MTNKTAKPTARELLELAKELSSEERKKLAHSMVDLVRKPEKS